MRPNFGFRLEKINTEQFAIMKESYSQSNGEIALAIDLEFGTNSDDCAIKSTVKFQFIQNDNIFLLIVASCEYTVDEESWSYFENEKKKNIPKEFLSHLAMITVGTTRGILHSKTENTMFNEFFIPTKNISELIKEDLKLDL